MALTPITIDSAGGEYMEAVLVVDWHAAPGEAVRAGQVLVTVETAKAATDVECPADGYLAEIGYATGQEAPVGAVLGTISDTPVAAVPAAAAPTAPAPPRPAPSAASVRPRVLASPLARRIAAAAGLDLAGIRGSGPNGRIKRRDVEAALAARPVAPAAAPGPLAAPVVLSAPLPVVLLHGFGAEGSAWRQVVPLLPAGQGWLTPDLPGHGSRAAAPATTLPEIAIALDDTLAAGITDCHLVGHSLGGAAAIALAALGRVSLRSLTLIAPAGLGPEINGGFLAGLGQATTAEALAPWLNLMVGDPASLPQGYARAALHRMGQLGNRAALQAMAAALFPGGTQTFDLTGALAAVEAPCRILWGKADAVIPPAHAARAPAQAAVHLLPGVGHVPHLETPGLTARLITQTLRSAG
ncbi:MAG: alpha/beta fold hydrolase [Paracoccaceae bacterium]